VGANSNVGDVVNVNQVSVRSANSAGLQDLSTILSSAYQGEVVIDTINGQSGTDVPVGTRATPVNNIADALIIAAKEGANTLRFAQNTTISNITIPQGFVLTSDSPALVQLTVDPSATVQGCEFSNVKFQGRADGIIRECLLLDVDYVSGFIFQCSLEGTISIVPGALCALLSCFSNTLAGQPNPIIDFNGTGKVILRDYQGAIELTNHTDTSGDGDLCLTTKVLLSLPTIPILAVTGIYV
jgi:hypothetical protein